MKEEKMMPDFKEGLSVPLDKLVLYWTGPDQKLYSITMQDVISMIDSKQDKESLSWKNLKRI
jgi:hypothetical protein